MSVFQRCREILEDYCEISPDAHDGADLVSAILFTIAALCLGFSVAAMFGGSNG